MDTERMCLLSLTDERGWWVDGNKRGMVGFPQDEQLPRSTADFTVTAEGTAEFRKCLCTVNFFLQRG